MSADAEKEKNEKNMTDDTIKSTKEDKESVESAVEKVEAKKLDADAETVKESVDTEVKSDIHTTDDDEMDGKSSNADKPTKPADEKDDELDGAVATKNGDTKLPPVDKKPVDKKDQSTEDDEDDEDVDGDEENGKDGKKEVNNKSKKKIGMPLGDIVKIEENITHAQVQGLQTLHTLCYGAAGKANNVKRNLRKFSGYEFEAESEYFKKKLEVAQKLDIAKLKAVCEVLELDKKGSKDDIAERVCLFLVHPDGDATASAAEDAADDEPEEEDEPEDVEEEDEEEEEEVSSDEDKKKKKKPGRRSAVAEKPTGKRGRPEAKSSGGRPKRSTAGRSRELSSYVDYSSSEESERQVRPKVGKRKRGGDDSDSGSDYNPSGGGSESDAGKRRSGRARTRPSSGRRSKRAKNSDSEEEESISEEDDSDEPSAKKKRGPPAATPSRGARGRAAAAAARKKKQSESEEEDEESEFENDDSDAAPKSKGVSPKGRGSAAAAKNNKSKSSPVGRGGGGAGRGAPKRGAAAAKKKKTETSSEEEDEEDVDDKDEDSEDEPLSKKNKTAPPTDDEIKSFVKEILDEANLEEITMKTVCKQVYCKYPQFDLSHKKDFIKATVKSLIAT